MTIDQLSEIADFLGSKDAAKALAFHAYTYAIIDSEGRFVWFKGDVNSHYELELSSVPDPEDLIDQAAAKARVNRIMADAERHKDTLHFPVKITPLFQRHIMTLKDAKRGPANC
jgi:hypothetical protein